MTSLVNAIQNNALTALSSNAPRGVMSAIKAASHKTGVNFAYMVQQANAESSFTADAKAKTSSASGLYQFIESTWMSMVEKYGDKHGIETDGKTRGEILELRNDPRAASIMAAEFAGENQNFLKNHTTSDIGSTELYFAHFLGAGKAAAFINARDEDPSQQAALLFPKAAKANRSVFYDQGTGRAKSLDEVYAHFDKKFSIEDVKSTNIQTASLSYQGNRNADMRGLNSENSGRQIAGIQGLSNRNTGGQSAGMRGLNSGNPGRQIAYTQSLSSRNTNNQIARTQTASPTHRARSNDSISSSVFDYVKLNAGGQHSYNSMGGYRNLVTSPLDIMLLAQMNLPTTPSNSKKNEFSLFSMQSLYR